jgi:hypothetical protein
MAKRPVMGWLELVSGAFFSDRFCCVRVYGVPPKQGGSSVLARLTKLT